MSLDDSWTCLLMAFFRMSITEKAGPVLGHISLLGHHSVNTRYI